MSIAEEMELMQRILEKLEKKIKQHQEKQNRVSPRGKQNDGH